MCNPDTDNMAMARQTAASWTSLISLQCRTTYLCPSEAASFQDWQDLLASWTS